MTWQIMVQGDIFYQNIVSWNKPIKWKDKTTFCKIKSCTLTTFSTNKYKSQHQDSRTPVQNNSFSKQFLSTGPTSQMLKLISNKGQITRNHPPLSFGELTWLIWFCRSPYSFSSFLVLFVFSNRMNKKTKHWNMQADRKTEEKERRENPNCGCY